MSIARDVWGYVATALILSCMYGVVVAAQTPGVSLSDVVFYGIPSVKELKRDKRLKQATCVQKYLKAVPPKSILYSAKAPTGPDDAVKVRKRNLEEQIVTVMGEKTRAEAKAFSSDVPLYTEWEGMSECPLAEAEFTARWLDKHSDARIAPFLHLFMAHRLRAGYEAAAAEGRKETLPVLARRYRESLATARASANPLVVCIADDLESQSHVYLEGHDRP
jgi:hypothetical protein